MTAGPPRREQRGRCRAALTTMKLLRLVAMLSRIPRPASTTSRLVPPSETSGSGTPVSGSTPRAAPTLMQAWPTMMAVMPVASSLPNSSLQSSAMRKHAQASATYSASSRHEADEAELLADDAGDHVGALFGQVAELLHGVAEAHAEDAAGGDGDERLGRLEAAALRVLPGVEEGGQALQAVGLDDDERQDQDDRRRRRARTGDAAGRRRRRARRRRRRPGPAWSRGRARA